MNGEMYVVQLINISEQVQNIATGILGQGGRERQLERLRDPDLLRELADKFKCSEEKVFEEFGKRIRASFAQRTPSSFTYHHLGLLRTYSALAPLGSLLQCSPEDVLGILFDSAKMKKTLKKVNPREAEAIPLDSAQLLSVISSKTNAVKIQLKHGVGDNNWGEIIRSEDWLSDQAVKALTDYAANQSLSSTDLTLVLAAFLDDPQPDQVQWDTEETRTFGWLTLTYLRQRLQSLAEDLREQAIKYVQEAMELDPSQLTLVRLLAWLEMYERGSVARTFHHLIANRKPLSAFVPKYTPLDLLVASRPDPEKHLVIAETQVREDAFLGFLNRRKFGSFEVHCVFQDEIHPRPVLRCHDLPFDIYKHLINIIPKLTGADLSIAGNSTSERLLNTLVLIPDNFLRLLSVGVERLGPVFAQCLVLSGTPLPVKLDIPWCDDLNDRLPYKKLDPTDDIKFLRDVNAIVDDWLREYLQSGKVLDVVGDS